MVSLSNTYNFGLKTEVADLFREAYERIGIIGNEQTPLHIQSALMSANLELTSWVGMGLNHWLVTREMFELRPNQGIYELPVKTVRIPEKEVTAIKPVRLNVGGVAFSTSGGNPNNCFDPQANGGCIQDAPNGSIGYIYGNGESPSILYVGVSSLEDTSYTLAVEYSLDGENWHQVYLSDERKFYNGLTNWFVIENSLNAVGWRITETGGETLKVRQIHFCTPTSFGPGDRCLSPISRYQYMTLSQKMSNATPSVYFFDQKNPPSLKLWPGPFVASLQNQSHIVYTSYSYAQDVNKLFQKADLPQRFYDALVAGLAARLAVKFAPDRYSLMQSMASTAYQAAVQTDIEAVPLVIKPDFDKSWDR